MANLNNLPQYYNLYDVTKQYTNLLFRSGYILQSSELNEMQSVLQTQIKSVGDTILTDGDIIEGCQLVIATNKRSVTVTAGRIYLSGNVRTVSATTISINGTGEEVIGAKINATVIYPTDDSALLDPATGWDNYGQQGACRLKETVTITRNDASAAILYTLIDGELLNATKSDDLTALDKVEGTLARRTWETNGNYKVSGLKLVPKGVSDTDNIYVTMEHGKAYIRGHEITKDAATTIAIPKANSLRQVDNEPKVFSESTLYYRLNNEHVADVIELSASVATQSSSITRGSIIGGIDYLPDSPVQAITEVTQGSTTFVQGTDYQLTNDGVDWSLNHNAPEPGSTYTVKWVYMANLTQGSSGDFTLGQRDSTNYWYITFTNGGRKPVAGTTFTIDYTFKLYRRDVISIDQTGTVIVTSGQPDNLRTVESPSVGNDNSMALGSVLVTPNSTTLSIINNDTQAVPMLALYKMIQRISTLEYNQAVSDLDVEAAAGEQATQLSGILTDGFIGFTKCDLTHSQWSAAINLDTQELMIPSTTTLKNLTISSNTGHKFTRLITGGYTESIAVSQANATSNFRINSYDAFPKTPVLTLDPAVDNWIDESHTVVQGGTQTTSSTLRRWWYHKGEAWADSEKAAWQQAGFADGGQSLGWDNGSVSVQKSATTTVLDEAVMYMRQKAVYVTIENLEAGANNIKCTFDGISVNLVATSSTYTGSTTGTLKADSNGVSRGYFMVPANVLCGTKEVRVWPNSTPSLVGIANYTAEGRTVQTQTVVWTERTVVQASDPVAQSFQFDTDRYLTAVGLYFCDKSSSSPVTIQVRNMVNGYPGTTVYAEKVVQASAVNTSATAASLTKVTFNDPVYCHAGEQYCFTILSNSNVDSLWVAQTGMTDITTGNQVSKNPYLNGVMFSSSNAMTWTAHQSLDLKFNLYTATFNTSSVVTFTNLTSLSFDRMMLAVNQSIPAGTSIQWEYKLNSGSSWLPIEVFDDRDVSPAGVSVQLRATINSLWNVSPAIACDSLLLAVFAQASSAVYITRNVYMADGFNNVKVVVDLAIPTGSNVTVHYATDTSGTEWNAMTNTGSIQKSTEYTTYTFEGDVGSTKQNFRIKITLTSNNALVRPKAMNLRCIAKTVSGD